MNPTYNFTGQVALVTGASSGLGFATAKAFAEAGAKVVMSADKEETLTSAASKLAAAGHEVLAIVCDVANEADVAKLVEQTVAEFGRLDMAFNNAGIQGPHEAFTVTSAEAYDAVNNVNLRGVWACMKHELLQMEKQGSGVIVNCSSLGGLVGQAGRAAYHGTKHGVLGLTKSAGVEYAARGIRVNAVCPGVFDTPMLANMKKSKPEELNQVIAAQPIGRLGDSTELAAAVLWLCSPGASFVIGSGLSVDGGFTAQ
ncbi:glucose 1-dehydrogenase [Duganella levis]|uniref:Glucose 1-dehydrogenase n=1 Tax=Duganella levis TaxID=2692169 RepID=A0ABW9VZ43_9BURK|nr:glucose 1-dehydrogenase [Duganella levis]MYN26964.1 glucose 1-dehydrogenase [Duganella levis]